MVLGDDEAGSLFPCDVKQVLLTQLRLEKSDRHRSVFASLMRGLIGPPRYFSWRLRIRLFQCSDLKRIFHTIDN